MITVNEPIIVAKAQNIKWEAVTIKSGGTNPGDPKGVFAMVQFGVYNEKNERVTTKTVLYAGADYNRFWTAFNNGRFLYVELNDKARLGVTVPDSVEAEFTNA
jgi:hypothetical protein